MLYHKDDLIDFLGIVENGGEEKRLDSLLFKIFRRCFFLGSFLTSFFDDLSGDSKVLQ